MRCKCHVERKNLHRRTEGSKVPADAYVSTEEWQRDAKRMRGVQMAGRSAGRELRKMQISLVAGIARGTKKTVFDKMKANELMIGDLVRVSKDVCLKKGTIVKIHGIDADNVFTEKDLKGSATCMQINDPDRLTGGVWCDYLEPIPLTPEILEKNGFNYDEDRKAYLMGVIFQVKPEKYGLFSFVICGCPYSLNSVHQLQHALKLCGIEKEIEL